VQKPDFVFRRNGRVHLNRQGRQFSRLLAAGLCASAVVMLDTTCSEVVWKEYWIPTPFASYLFLPLPCVAVCHHISTGLYNVTLRCVRAPVLPRVFVAFVILQSALGRIYIDIYSLSGSTTFRHWLINGATLEKNITEDKMCVLMFSTSLSAAFIMLRKT